MGKLGDAIRVAFEGKDVRKAIADLADFSEDNTGIYKNRGLTYPLTNIDISVVPDTFKNFISNGILDIKIYNADPTIANYRFRYIAKNNTTYDDLVLIQALDASGNVVRELFNTEKKTYTLNDNGITVLALSADNGSEVVRLVIDYSLISSGSVIDFSNATYKCNTNYISSDCILLNTIGKNAVTNTMLYNKALTTNKGIDYPIVYLSGTVDTYGDIPKINNGLLDIKIFNAALDTDYNFGYITKDQTTFGDLIIVNAINRTTSATRALFATSKKTYSISDRNGISTLVLPAENGSEIVELTFDYSAITSGFIPHTSTGTQPFKNNIISKDCLYYQNSSSATAYKNLVEFDLTNNIANVYSKYGSQDLKVQFKKAGANSLFALYYVYSNPSTSSNPTKFANGTQITGGDSDWIGPYIVQAVNNGDGGGKSYTGGSHGKDNTITGLPTAQTAKYEIFADGKKVAASGDYLCNQVDIYVTNQIMAYNTRTLNRYVIEEQIHYNIIGSTVNVDVTTKALEDVIIEEYYGLQTIDGTLDQVYYVMGQYTTNQVTNAANDSGPKSGYFINKYILSKNSGSDRIIVSMDNTVGLGQREFLPDTEPCAFTRDYGKSYMKLAYNNTVPTTAGKRLIWKGKYEFVNS